MSDANNTITSQGSSNKNNKTTSSKGSKSSDKDWKGSLVRLISCGSGKKKSNMDKASAPLERPENIAPTSAASTAETQGVISMREGEVRVTAHRGQGSEDAEEEISFTEQKIIGKGTFGVVCLAEMSGTGEMVAVKKIFHDERFKNRELQMMRGFNHPNILPLRYYFYSHGERYKSNEVYLNLILDYMPDTLYSVSQCDGTNKPLMELIYVKVYMYQVFRSLAYLHSLGICHRDVKPQNLLLNPETCAIKLCDFGSAKELHKGEPNIAYICSRYYRAPELILGTTNYTQQIDVWSAGCVLGELLLGQPLFPGANGPNQLVEIIKILGTPTHDDVYEINPHYVDFRFPQLTPRPWNKVFKDVTDPDVLDLVPRLIVYAPSLRMSPLETCAHSCFDQLRNPRTRLPNGRPLPPLFNFTEEELAIDPQLNSRLIPAEVAPLDFSCTPDDSFESTPSTSPNRNSFLGQIGDTLRSSLHGLTKTPSSASSKKKKRSSAAAPGEPEPQAPPGPDGEESATHVHTNEAKFPITADPADHNAEILEDVVERIDNSARICGLRDDSIPADYLAFLEAGGADAKDFLPSKAAGLEVQQQTRKKKKRNSQNKALETSLPMTDDIERSIEASIILDPEGGTGEGGGGSAAPVSKSRGPRASTPTNEPKSFEDSPLASPEMQQKSKATEVGKVGGAGDVQALQAVEKKSSRRGPSKIPSSTTSTKSKSDKDPELPLPPSSGHDEEEHVTHVCTNQAEIPMAAIPADSHAEILEEAVELIDGRSRMCGVRDDTIPADYRSFLEAGEEKEPLPDIRVEGEMLDGDKIKKKSGNALEPSSQMTDDLERSIEAEMMQFVEPEGYKSDVTHGAPEVHQKASNQGLERKEGKVSHGVTGISSESEKKKNKEPRSPKSPTEPKDVKKRSDASSISAETASSLAEVSRVMEAAKAEKVSAKTAASIKEKDVKKGSDVSSIPGTTASTLGEVAKVMEAAKAAKIPTKTAEGAKVTEGLSKAADVTTKTAEIATAAAPIVTAAVDSSGGARIKKSSRATKDGATEKRRK